MLLTTRQTTKLKNAIENNMSTDIKLSKVQISKIIQFGGFLGKLLSPLLKTGLPLLKSVIKPLGLLGLTAIDGGIQEKIYSGSGTTTFAFSNKELNDIIKIVQALEDSGILLRGVTKTIKDETKEQKGGVLSMLLGISSVSLFGDLLTKNLSGKENLRSRKKTVRAGEVFLRAVEGFLKAGEEIRKKL